MDAEGLVATRDLAGTKYFDAPEVKAGIKCLMKGRKYDKPASGELADVYSSGMTILELASGCRLSPSGEFHEPIW
jgi:serine/threonine protein kinase